ncbi:MAG: hypothetical protein OSA97_20010 [Nevskia sp.]|nr:hypothetical protein [Nevskia sp.]
MADFGYPRSDESTALANALLHFLHDRIEEGKAELLKIRSEVLDRVYAAGLRLGIEAHTLLKQR